MALSEASRRRQKPVSIGQNAAADRLREARRQRTRDRGCYAPEVKLSRFLALLTALAAAPLARGGDDEALKSHAERTHFEETSRLADVESFLRELSLESNLVRVSTFGASEEARPLWLATLSNPPVNSPRELRALNRPVVFVQANIHAGEVEGKEAVQNLMARLALRDLRPLLDQVVVMIAPVYNVDGNEAIDVNNRTEQYGPIAGVGKRENAKGLDLNRDYMKLESAEARALVQLMNEWDPQVIVDLHTTDGSYHGYHLTYSIPVNLSFEPRLLDYERNELMPSLGKTMLAAHGYRTYYYGNFEGDAPKAGEPEKRTWNAFDQRPRIGQNYVGLRNRIAILSEAYSYLDFKSRIAVTESFVEEILRNAAQHGGEILALTSALDREFVKSAQGDGELLLGVEYKIKALAELVPLLVGEVTHQENPRNKKPMTVAQLDKFTAVPMQDLGYFAPTRSVPMARVYVLPREDAMKPIVAKLQQHGILVEELCAALSANLQSFQVEHVTKSNGPFQGHNQTKLAGKFIEASTTLPVGTLVVRLAQPLGRLAAYLLEPESDDGLVNWNFFDAMLAEGKSAPVRKIMGNVPMSARALEHF